MFETILTVLVFVCIIVAFIGWGIAWLREDFEGTVEWGIALLILTQPLA